jgi:hypothetical protein
MPSVAYDNFGNAHIAYTVGTSLLIFSDVGYDVEGGKPNRFLIKRKTNLVA